MLVMPLRWSYVCYQNLSFTDCMCVNVKSVAKGQHKQNDYMKPIKEENRVEILAELQKFANWVKRWQNQFPNYGLSKPTFETIFQTVVATIELSNYLLDEKDEIVYVLLGLIQSDYLREI